LQKSETTPCIVFVFTVQYYRRSL